MEGAQKPSVAHPLAEATSMPNGRQQAANVVQIQSLTAWGSHLHTEHEGDHQQGDQMRYLVRLLTYANFCRHVHMTVLPSFLLIMRSTIRSTCGMETCESCNWIAL